MTSIPSDVPPQAKPLEKLAPGILWIPAAPPWRQAMQFALSKLLLIMPGFNQDKQQAWRWPVEAWPDLPAFVRFSMQ
eukprot:1148236-Pelagomonas_calceolata.AAC.7